MITVSLEELQESPNLRTAWADSLVYIYSHEHEAYWRPNGAGYTKRLTDGVGIFDFSRAWELTKHCSAEKGIEFEKVEYHA